MRRRPVGLPEHLASLDRTLVMGVLNVTPDSFSDGGLFATTSAAIDHGLSMCRSGADIIDIGGESTRPGAQRISPDEELSRVIPVVQGLAAAGATLSVDTMRAEVAQAAVSAGAHIINDVSGGLADPAMLTTMAQLDCPVILMHWRALSDVMDSHAIYDDVVADVCRELAERAHDAVSAGVAAAGIVLDPGLGFAKDGNHNWKLLQDYAALDALGFPLLIGASRKRFLGSLLESEGVAPAPADRDAATHAVSALSAAAGAWCVRVHDVRGTADAVRVAAAWGQGGI